MDSLFGLPRKKSAGVSHRKPLFGNLFFHNQSEVDLFVSEYTCSKQGSNVSLHLVMNAFGVNVILNSSALSKI